MIAQEQLASLRGIDVRDRGGARIGTIGQVYLDTDTGQPTWASVHTGLFGLSESLVPLTNADLADDGVRVPYDKAFVKDAPRIDVAADEPLMDDEVALLYRYYGMSEDADGDRAPGVGGGADDAMTRSEEQLRVRKERQTVGRARLRKYVVTENVQVTVPVRREEIRVEREAVGPSDGTPGEVVGTVPDTGQPDGEVVEVILHEERPVVTTETVPVERVRLGKQTVTEEQTLTGEVRKERIETDLPGEDPGQLR